MVVLNINISADGKSISSGTSELTQAHTSVLPSPQSENAIESIGSEIPAPNSTNTIEVSTSLDAVPHPEGFGTSSSSSNVSVPYPEMDSAQSVLGNSDVPSPSDLEEGGSAKPKSTPKKTRTSKK